MFYERICRFCGKNSISKTNKTILFLYVTSRMLLDKEGRWSELHFSLRILKYRLSLGMFIHYSIISNI